MADEAKLVDVTDELLSKGSLSGFVGPDRPDVAFLAVHGTNAEDGAIQGLLQLLHIPFTGSGIQSSSLCMDKDRCKQILEAAGIRVPVGQLLRRGHIDTSSLPCPAVVKPNAQGSTVGLSFVENTGDLQSAIEAAFQYDNAVLVEEWVRGTEISVPVLIDRALLPVEIVPISGRYDFESKYTPGATEEICPARLDTALAQESQRIALAAHRAMGCEGVSRTDMIVSEGGIVVLEINTLPGMTSTSLLPRSAAQSGMSFDDLVDAIVQDALGRYAQKA